MSRIDPLHSSNDSFLRRLMEAEQQRMTDYQYLSPANRAETLLSWTKDFQQMLERHVPFPLPRPASFYFAMDGDRQLPVRIRFQYRYEPATQRLQVTGLMTKLQEVQKIYLLQQETDLLPWPKAYKALQDEIRLQQVKRQTDRVYDKERFITTYPSIRLR